MSNLFNVCMAAGGAAVPCSLIAGLVARQIAHGAKRVADTVVRSEIKELRQTLEARFTHNDAATDRTANDVADLKLAFARETGGNSGGFRQAINELTTEVAHIKGSFDQHVIEQARK